MVSQVSSGMDSHYYPKMVGFSIKKLQLSSVNIELAQPTMMAQFEDCYTHKFI